MNPEHMSMEELIRTIEDSDSTPEVRGLCARALYNKGKADAAQEHRYAQYVTFLQERAFFSSMIPTPCRF